jgi:hypothetical protein
MGMVLWGESPLYIVWRAVIIDNLKSTSRRQGRKGDQASERSLSANLRTDEQKLHIKAEPQGESAQHDEALPDLWGRVNAAVVRPNEVTSALGVWGRIMFLPGEICRLCDHPQVVAPHVVMHGVIGQKSADGIVVDS